MVNRFSSIRAAHLQQHAAPDGAHKPFTAGDGAPLYDEKPLPAHTERVHVEMFRAIENLGRKLERAEEERDRLTRRLALLESVATLDEKTGQFYLPAVIDPSSIPTSVTKTPKWAVAASVMSVAVAFFTLSVVVLQSPGSRLTPQQMAALDTIAATRFSSLDEKPWTKLDTPPIAPQEDIADATMPDTLPDTIPEIPDTLADASPDAPLDGEAASVIEPAAGQAATETPVKKVEITKSPVPPKTEIIEERPAENVTAAVTQEKPRSAPVPPKPATVTTQIAADDGLPADVVALEKRAFGGVAAAAHDLATIYAAGKTVPQDYRRAVYWFSRAADGGVANAHYNLGVMFQQGLGVSRDVRKAISWYRSAAELGHPEAMYNLGIAYIEGVGAKRNVERGAGYFRRAADAGVAQAAYNLGVLYESNFMGQIDLAQAIEWYERAEKLGHADASVASRRISQQLAAVAGTTEPAAGNP
jgi:hypothetical protein